VIHLLYFLLGAAFAAFTFYVLDATGIIAFWRVKFFDESGEMM
jgi:hypothetical protein